MKKSTLPLALALAGLLVSSASAQVYVGSDNFNDNAISGNWDFQYSVGAGVGTLTETNSRLEYTSSGTNQSRAIVWNNATNSSYTENWTASLTISNLTTPVSGYNMIGLQVFAANNLDLGYFGVFAFKSAGSGPNIFFETASAPGYVPSDFGPSPAETDLTDVFVQMSHNAATHDITLSYSQDGGATFLDSHVFNPGTAWAGAPTDGFSFRILGFSTSPGVGAGEMYADNFAVSAIPEPSTYAAFAGLGALGLAFWRRRQARAAAQA